MRLEAWRLALRMASSGRDLPLEHQLASASYVSLGRSDRTAVITACTAVEVGIRSFVRARYSQIASETAKQHLFGKFLTTLVSKGVME